MATIGSLTVNVVARTDQFVRGMGTARRHTSAFAQSIGHLKGIMVGFGATLAAGFSIGALRSTADEIDRIAKASDRLGLSTEALSGLAHAADLSGASFEQIVKGLTLLQKRLGSQDISADIKALNLDFDRLRALDADEAFLELAAAIGKLPDEARQTAAAMALFGRSGAELLPLLKEGGDGIRRMMEEAKALGLTFSRETAAQVEEMNDAFTRAAGAVKGLGQELLSLAAKPAQAAADALTNTIKLARAIAANDTSGLPGVSQNKRAYRELIGSLSAKEFDALGRALGGAQGKQGMATALRTFGFVGVDSAQEFSNIMAAIDARTKTERRAIQQEFSERRKIQEAGGGGPRPGFFGPDLMPVAIGESIRQHQRRLGERDLSLMGLTAEQHRITSAVEQFILTQQPREVPRRMGVGGGPRVPGFQALEAGTAEAFAQERRSANQGVGIEREQLQELKKQNDQLKAIDANTKKVQQFDVIHIA